MDWLKARLGEPSTWGGIAAFCTALGTALVSAGWVQTGTVIGCVGGGFSGVVAFVKKEKGGGA